MTPIQPDEFRTFFHALHGVEPFPWQRRLAARVAAGTWPEVLDLPTASGKTACIDVAVFALACQAALPPGERTAFRRIFFVVDRRVIVDAAYRRALAIAGRLRPGGDGRQPILARVGEALRHVGGLDSNEDPLACVQLRGGVYRDQSWARMPTRPTVITSTVDQVGSRLLFRGYGVSDSLRPIHAALAGNDALILLDEAHCARPFLQTARAVADYRRLVSPRAPAPPPFHVAILSATPPSEVGDEGEDAAPFRLDDEDRLPEHLGPRLAASKPASLVEPVNAPFKPGAARDKFAEALARQARDLAGSDGARAVVVFVNRVETARAVHQLLDAGHEADAVLMIGRMRPIDRDELIRTWNPKIRSGADRSALDRTVFVVATACLEVGADFDFDVLVTESASLDALRQRFGRLNRLGRPVAARAAILARADQVREGAKPDPIYGEALARTWQWLHLPEARIGDALVDFGIDALALRLPDSPRHLEGLNAPASDAPVLLPSYIDCWVQTAPRPEPDPDPALFLHGPNRDRPEVQVCWRADLSTSLDDEERRRTWTDTVSLCPPVAAECMRVPLHLVRAWLGGQERPADDDGDVEHAATPEFDAGTPAGPEGRLALLWAGPDDERTGVVTGDADLRPSDMLVIPAAFEGWEVLGHIPGPAPSDPAERAVWVASKDVAEPAYQAAGRRALIRLDPRVMAGWPSGPALSELLTLSRDRENPEGDLASIRAALRDLAEELGDRTPWLRDVASGLARDRKARLLVYPDHLSRAPDDLDPETEALAWRYPGGLVVQGSEPLGRGEHKPDASDEATTEDDTASIATRPIPLDLHSHAVARAIGRSTDILGLPDSVRLALAAAALWHDLGKSDRRFQTLLQDGNAQEARLAPSLLAKSGKVARSKHGRERARRRSGWPDRGRHELLSARLAESLLERLNAGVDRDLVLHLIASHHGYARPLAPFAEDLEPGLFPADGDHHRQLTALALGPVGGGEAFAVPAADPARPGLHRLDGGLAERFWTLVRRYGWWGLAWLEALLRLADHHVSEHEQGPEEE